MGSSNCKYDCDKCPFASQQGNCERQMERPALQKIDRILTDRWLGLPILLLVLLAVFEATFTLGSYPQAWIEAGFENIKNLLQNNLTQGWLSSLLTGGIVEGVGTVLSFLPNIIILFCFLSILEESGYMDRAAFVMDFFMHRIGLHGRSFVPMLIGFGCNVPAIMAARSIKNPRDRLLTMLMIPFMSCSARLPVYMLFVSVFFEKYKALIMIGLYALGVVLSILLAVILKHSPFFKKGDDSFDREPVSPFRIPDWKSTGVIIWDRTKDYLQKITTVIIAASAIIWALEYFPADRTANGSIKEASYLAMIGKTLEPIMEPIGFDWKMNVCILTGLPAKEAIVSTMGILYHSEDDKLADALRANPDFTPASCIAFLVFVLLYFPCVSTIATLSREAGKRWAAFTVLNSIILAWVVAYIAFRLVLLFI